MFLQQNLFSIYRLILKTPKIILLSALVFTLFIAITQLAFLYKINQTNDFSPALLEYMIMKNQQRQQQIEHNKLNTTVSNLENNSTEQGNETISNDFAFLDDSTILHFRLQKIDKFQIALNYTSNLTKQKSPFMVMIKNQHLSYLKNTSQEYLQRHGITYDEITLPLVEIQRPMFTYYYNEDMQKKEIMMQSLRQSFFTLEVRFNLYRLQNNITDAEIQTNQLYLNFEYQSNSGNSWLLINFFQFITFKVLPPLFLKIVFGFGSLLLIFGSNVFIGLLIRYIIISAFTLFLTLYDKCLVESGGWMHQYLLILYQRFQQNRLKALKMMLFFIISNIGMSLLLAFGAYCILAKLLLPSLPLLIDDYASFFMKTIFFVQIFHLIFSRSRTTIRFFPLFSFMTTFLFLTICSLKSTPTIMILLNLNLTIQIIFFIIFIFIEKIIMEQNEKGFTGVHCPTYRKPRMLFYAGYDISWQKSLPPIWTYFTSWFDYSYFNQSEKSLLERDYQLLYGRMLGFNERQEIPQEEEEEVREEPLHAADQPSNEMNLIQREM